MVKELQPMFVPQTDNAHESPENLEKPGAMGKALLNAFHKDWEEDIMSLAANVRDLLKRGYLPQKNFGGIVKHWDEFRKYLLTLHNSPQPVSFDTSRFAITQETLDSINDAAARDMTDKGVGSPAVIQAFQRTVKEQAGGVTPMQIAAWVRGSQRIFSLSAEAIDKWTEAEYADRKWEEILAPFDSFLIELRRPIVHDTSWGVVHIHGILVTRIASIDPGTPAGHFECVHLTTDKNNNVHEGDLSKDDLKKLKAAAKGQKNIDQLDEVLRKTAIAALTKIGPHALLSFRVDELESVTSRDLSDLTNLTRKIIAGACIYLSRKRKKSDPPIMPLPPRPPIKNLKHMNVITDPAHVLTIGHVHNFDPLAETEGSEYEGGPKSPHHRRAFMRRAPGSPQSAEPTIKVKATVVNRHLLPRDAIPKGTVTKL